MDKFKVGDRVKLMVKIVGIRGEVLHKGLEGTILHSEWNEGYKDFMLGVSFEGFDDGHTCEGRLTDNSGWYVWAEEAEHVSQ